MRKYVLAFLFTVLTFAVMFYIQSLIKVDIRFLVGWFPVTSWFATINYCKVKEGVEFESTSWKTYLAGFIGALIMSIIGNLFGINQMLNGFIAGVIYSIATLSKVKREY